MKKKNKQIIMVLFIVIIFGLSSVAFVANNVFGPTEQQIIKLDKYIIDGDINETLTYQYINNGYTFLRFYYKENDPFIQYIEQIPESYKTSVDQIQIFVLKIPANETYMKITNLNGVNEIHNLTYEKIFDALCEYLVITTTECGFKNIMLNQTNAK
jgi:hypothetical protein